MQIRPLLKRIAAGDTRSFSEIVTHYQRPLFGFLGRMSLTQAVAEEVAQESFLRAWRHLGDYDPDTADFSTWLFTIARNLALNELARPANRWETKVVGNVPEVTCDCPRPLESIANDELKARLLAALLQLPLAERSIVALAYVKDLDMAAIAQIEGCTVGALKTRLHRAKLALRQLLETSND